MTNQEMAAKLAAFCTTHTWNENPVTSKPEPSSRKEENAVDVLATDEDDDFLMDTEDVRPPHVQMQCMFESSL